MFVMYTQSTNSCVTNDRASFLLVKLSTVDLHMHSAQWREPKVYTKLCISSMGTVSYGSPFTLLIFPTIAQLSLPHVEPSLGFCERICMNLVPEWVTSMVSAIFIVCVTISHPELPNMPGHTNVSLYWIEAVRINKNNQVLEWRKFGLKQAYKKAEQ